MGNREQLPDGRPGCLLEQEPLLRGRECLAVGLWWRKAAIHRQCDGPPEVEARARDGRLQARRHALDCPPRITDTGAVAVTGSNAFFLVILETKMRPIKLCL